MSEAVEVLLWGRRIGVASRVDGAPCASFAYDREFQDAGIEPSPLMMPVGIAAYSFPALPQGSFHGLPGMLSDSVPDKFGNAVIRAWLKTQGRLPESLTPIERLCYTGVRGMGALEYKPTMFDDEDKSEEIHVDALAELADEVLKSRTEAAAKLVPDMKRYSSILKVGSSAGGARAKALIGWNEATGEVRSGQVALPEGFGYWLIKFDGLTGNGDKEGDDKWGYGRVEYAYHLMARAAGIEMTECRLWNKRHFMTRRFDRLADGGKLHAQTLGALAHMDFNDPAAYSYEQAFRVTRRVVNDARANEQLFRRMAFNVLAWNCDDHVKRRPREEHRVSHGPARRVVARPCVRRVLRAQSGRRLDLAPLDVRERKAHRHNGRRHPLLRALREHARAQGARGAGRSQERGPRLAALRRRGGGPR